MGRFHFNQDVLAGLIFFAFGAFFLWFGRSYPAGTALSMGPGYFPMLLGGLLVVVGLVISSRGIWRSGLPLSNWALRPLLFICASFFVFALSIERLGLVVTAIVCMIIAGHGGSQFRWTEQVILAAASTIVAAVGFIWALGLPMKYWPPFFGTGY